MEWWRRAVVYQVYPRSFQDTDGDGVGDLDGVTLRLPYLADTLGVDAVWLSPFYRSPMADFGYDVADHCGVDPLFGDLTAFDRLLERAHDLGLRVIVDIVPNHTSDRHPWFEASRSSRDDPKRDWYVWRDGRDGGPPNNWLSVFGGPAWTFDPSSGQWYLHSFLPEQPDLDWRTPEVEAATLDVFRFWLDRGVDGFRVDVAHFIMKDPELRDNPPRTGEPPDSHKPPRPYDHWDHVHDKGHPDVHAAYRRVRAVLDSYDGDRFAVGEIHLYDPDEWASYYGEGDELHMPFNFALLPVGWDAAAVRRVVEETERVVPPWAWPNYVLGNHDETRIATRLGAAQSRAAAVLLLTLRGTPTLYYGDELGLPEADIPPARQQDPWGRSEPGLGRDGCRTPMQWDASEHAGFSSAEPWLPLTADLHVRNVAVQAGDPASHLSLYRRMLAIRRSSAALCRGSYRTIAAPDGVFAYERREGDDVVRVAIAFTAAGGAADIGPGEVLVSTDAQRSGHVGRTVALGSHEAVVVAG
jgi:glycosidase